MSAQQTAWRGLRGALLAAAMAGLAHAQWRPTSDFTGPRALTFTSADHPGQAPDLDPPLEQTVEGRPIDATQPPTAVLNYIKHEMQVQTNSPDADMLSDDQIPPILEPALVPIVARFGLATLLKAYHLDSGAAADSVLQIYERRIILEAMAKAATDNDLPALMDEAKSENDILFMILENPAWFDNAQVDDLVSQKLDGLKDEDFGSSLPLLERGLASSSTDLTSKTYGLIQKRIDKAGLHTTESGDESFQLDRVMIECIGFPSKTGSQFFPSWAAMKKARLGDQQREENVQPYASLLSSVAQAFGSYPESFEQTPLRDGLQDLIAPAKGSPDLNVMYDFLAAGAGDVTAFKELIQAYHLPSESQTSSDQKPSMIDPTQPGNSDGVTLAGMPVKNPSEIAGDARSLLRQVTYLGAGDRIKGIFSNIDHATYSNGKWTVKDPGYTPLQITDETPIMPGQAASGSLNPPLGTMLGGVPIDATMSSQVLLQYVDQETRSRMIVINRGDAAFPPGLNKAMVPVVAKFGLSNLLQARQQTRVPPDYDPEDASVGEVAGYERDIILKALKAAATRGDIPVLIKAATDDKDLFWFIFNKPDWRGDASLEAFAAQQLDGIDLNHLADSPVVQFAIQDSSPTLSGILSERLKSWIVEAGSEGPSFESTQFLRALDKVVEQMVRAPDQALRQNFPAWASMKVKRYQDGLNPQKMIDYLGLFDLVSTISDAPGAFQDASVRQGIAILIVPAATEHTDSVNYDYLAAGIGDATAFREFLSAYHQVKGMPPPTPDNPLQVVVSLNGESEPDPRSIQQCGASLMKIVTYQCAPGGKADDVFDHLDRSTYNNGLWTVTDGSPAASAVTIAEGAASPSPVGGQTVPTEPAPTPAH